MVSFETSEHLTILSEHFASNNMKKKLNAFMQILLMVVFDNTHAVSYFII